MKLVDIVRESEGTFLLCLHDEKRVGLSSQGVMRKRLVRGSTLGLWLFLIALCGLLAGCGKEEKRQVPETRLISAQNQGARRMRGAGHEGAKKRANASSLAASRRGAPQNPARPETGGRKLSVSGRVVLDNGSPATSASVCVLRIHTDSVTGRAERQLVAQTTASAEGRFRLEAKHVCELYLEARLVGRARQMVRLPRPEVTPGETPKPVEQVLVLQKAVPFAGRVINEQNEPVSGASILANETEHSAYEVQAHETTSSLDGRFALEELGPGKKAVSIQAEGYPTMYEVLNFARTDLVFRLKRGGASVEGIVLRKDSGEAVSSASVALSPRSPDERFRGVIQPQCTLSDAQGHFRVGNLAAGAYLLSARKGGLQLLPDKSRGEGGLVLKENETTSGLVCYLIPGYTLNGCVLDSETSAALEGVKLTAVERDETKCQSVETTASGTFCLKGLESCNVQLRVEKEGYFLFRVPGSQHWISQSYIESKPEEPESTVTMLMRKATTISGIVRTGTGAPVSAATVRVFSDQEADHEGREYHADANGRFEVSAAAGTRYRLVAAAGGYPETHSDPIAVHELPVSGVELVLYAGGEIRGTVEDAQGQGVEGAEITACRARQPWDFTDQPSWSSAQVDTRGRERYQARSGTGGAFELSGVPGVAMLVSAKKEEVGRSKSQPVQPKPGQCVSGCRLVLRGIGFIAGCVRDPKGKPVVGATVYAYSPQQCEGDQGAAVSGADGSYRIEELVDTSYTLNASHPDYRYEERTADHINISDADITLLPCGEALGIGTVVDYQSGQPVRDFEVTVGGNSNGCKAEKDSQIPGRFLVRNIRRERGAWVEVKAPGYMTKSVQFDAVQGKTQVERIVRLGHGATVRGRVVTKGEKKPLSGARVVLGSIYTVQRDKSAPSLTLGEDGRFEFKMVESGGGSVGVVTVDSEVKLMVPYYAAHDQVTDLGDIEVGSGATIKGRVVRMPGEEPVAGVMVQISGGKDVKVLSDKDGRFSVAGLPNDSYTFYLSEYQLLCYAGAKLSDGETREVVIRLSNAKVKGQVLRGGKPEVANVRVTGGTASEMVRKYAETDSEGRFTLDGLAAGEWMFTVSSSQGSVIENVQVPASGQIERVFELPSGRIAGKVLDASGQGVAEALVCITLHNRLSFLPSSVPRTESAASKADGTFELKGVPAGSYRVFASKPGAGTAVADIVVPKEGDAAPFVLKLGEGESGTLVSVALNMQDGQPLVDAVCYVFDAAGNNLSYYERRDDHGVLRIELPAGVYRVRVSASGFSETEHQVEVKSGETVKLEDVLYPAGELWLTLCDKSGQPLVGVPCTLAPADPSSIEQPRSGQTLGRGLWQVRALVPGVYHLSATLPGKSPVSMDIKIDPCVKTNVQKTVE